MIQDKMICGGQGSYATELWEQQDSNPEWPVFVSVVVSRKSCTGKGDSICLKSREPRPMECARASVRACGQDFLEE